jgi:GGDEF domain-containing protein
VIPSHEISDGLAGGQLMRATVERRLVLLAAADRDRGALHAALVEEAGAGWDVAVADSLDHARFLAQADVCDVLLLDGGLGGDAADADRLAERLAAPVVYLAEPSSGRLLPAPPAAPFAWLPRDLALRHPELVRAAVHQAAQLGRLREELARARAALDECRRRIERLAGRLWECSPADGAPPWYSERYMLERLSEEVARAQRHGGPLAVVLGEVIPEGRPGPEEWAAVRDWAVGQVRRARRRCDVAGQYGPDGFMLILPRTTDAGAASLCRRLRQLLQPPTAPADRRPRPFQAYFGAATFAAADADTSTAKGLLRLAEERLEQSLRGTAETVVS